MTQDLQSELLKHLSPQAFQAFGMGQVAYIRKAVAEAGQIVYVVHAADGTAISLAPNFEEACVLAKRCDLDAVSVQ